MVSITCGKLYDLCLKTPDRAWFGPFDCLWRWLLSVVAWYYAAITCPVSFFVFTLQYNRVWYGTRNGLCLTCFYPITPWVLFVMNLCTKIVLLLRKNNTDMDWGVFFKEPDSFILSLLWSQYQSIGSSVGLWITCGNDPDAITHSFYDYKTSKHFWREVMEKAGMLMPCVKGRWMKGDLTIFHELDCDLVLKITDSYLGIGDKFLDFGKDYNGKEDVERMLKEDMFQGPLGTMDDYNDKDVLLLELVRPDEVHGVHSFDILTLMTANGPKVLSVLYWGDCTNSSSHSARAGYTVDVVSETIYGPASWYSVPFATMEPKLVGTKLPGIKGACEKALLAHAESYERFPHLKMIGWDAMYLKNKDIVFFEGNFASARIPRRIFLGHKQLILFLTTYTWPFA
uniref:Alpha-L-glutamate ligase-related protein ATP-grasp domain-containing protein n=2 Tax=Octactis speculum TaxID=3111310 RepID=A0A7S2ALL6_9STRA|mmetsp:Transcript_12106/g.15960  ORF Transcript_12106/g.15960 Transcript_12106/m.15960 type:complete len:398 (+) Transcript_12106:73-1266(+)